MRADVIVAGAGIVGISAALHLQARGREVVLLDRRGPGEETSYGNAGLIERSSVVPYAFPRAISDILRYAMNGAPDAYYHLSFLPKLAPWLARYWWHSSPKRLAEASRAMLPLIERSVAEHDPLIEAAGLQHLVARKGWIEVYRRPKSLDKAHARAESLNAFGLDWAALDGAALRELEPHLGEALIGGVHWRDPAAISDPGALVKGYAALFEKRGGRIVNGNAASLAAETSGGWSVEGEGGRITARDAVLALGPWSNDVYGRLGYRFPLAVKRGYHMHFSARGNAFLNRPVVDKDNGYVLAPMARGIRLTTGAEFADRDAPPSPVQLERTEPLARGIFPLESRVEAEPWMGRRPILPDMRPVIGPAPRHKGLWFAFGHAHHGLTLGPVTGRLIAEMVTGGETVVDPRPYAASRF